MLARAQQLIVATGLMLAAAWLLWCLVGDRPGAAMLGLVALGSLHAVVLGLEFLLMHWINRDDPAPRATGGQVLTAWWGEVRAATRVFGWRQPFRSRAIPDRLTTRAADPARRGVVLIHGYVCNRGLWNPWLARLSAEDRIFVAVNLEPVMGSIDDYVEAVEAAIGAVAQATGRAPVVVAHSMGGLVLRRWWVEAGNEDRVHHAITIGTPHQGTWLARFAMSPNARQMKRDSRWLSALRAREPADRGRRMTCFYGHCDNIVFPASTALHPGAELRHLPAVAHVHMAERPEPWAELQRRLQD